MNATQKRALSNSEAVTVDKGQLVDLASDIEAYTSHIRTIAFDTFEVLAPQVFAKGQEAFAASLLSIISEMTHQIDKRLDEALGVIMPVEGAKADRAQAATAKRA